MVEPKDGLKNDVPVFGCDTVARPLFSIRMPSLIDQKLLESYVTL